ncbi:CPBP family intramembrane metalloprotease [Clostridium sp. P21]|uniref:CPBP family intramembrane metalloprotease n=1 Tax=Clostridium muellerianum TaxID=2716538 RepID=A0A7Y0EGH8_9CLOT|nr:CPBP family intramembrane glutamic endopeptidase [Clostridium muellerianum]NMM62993.1 CPBP family intramembrane metalloprotease [Clostridium muellerianum]
MQIINLLLSSVIQILMFSIIPFIWWAVRDRKKYGFLRWLGIKKPIIKNKAKYLMTFILIIIFLIILSIFVIPIFVDKSIMATNQFSGQGVAALIPAFIYAFLQTAFSEELFFRGFLTKRLIHKFGFEVGNIIQGLLFGAMHGVLFMSKVALFYTIVIVFFTGFLGLLMGWINEKQSEGSIISSWLLHGCFNIVASIIAMFNLGI